MPLFSVSLRRPEKRASDDPYLALQPHALLGCLPGRRASRRHGLQEGRGSDRASARAARIPPRKLKKLSARRWIGDAFKIPPNTVHEKSLAPIRPRSARLENPRPRSRCRNVPANREGLSGPRRLCRGANAAQTAGKIPPEATLGVRRKRGSERRQSRRQSTQLRSCVRKRLLFGRRQKDGNGAAVSLDCKGGSGSQIRLDPRPIRP